MLNQHLFLYNVQPMKHIYIKIKLKLLILNKEISDQFETHTYLASQKCVPNA